ncbi:MAG: sugar transferase [Planctomycetota bacterium]
MFPFYSRTGLPRLGRRRCRSLPALSASDFEAAYLRERSRANRSLRPFSVVTVATDPKKQDRQPIACEVLDAEKRCSDTLGRIDRRTLGLLLPDTDGAGAWCLADRIRSQLAERACSAELAVFTHGFDAGGTDSGHDDDHAGGLGAHNGSRVAAGPSMIRREGVTHSYEAARDDASESDEPDSPERVALNVDSMSEIRRLAGPSDVEDLWLASCKQLSPWRRAMDVVVAGTALVALLPVFAVVAVAIKLTSPGPVFFVQRRAGVGGRPFAFIKFRSMYQDAEKRRAALEAKNEKDGPIFKIKNDPRLTPVGRFIRRTSIDELPQFYNVLVGEMTLIGPRPPTLNEVAKYEPWQRDRLSVPGGLTCIWQVSGRSDVGFEDWVRMDLSYALQRSPSLDFQLLTRTVRAVATGRGAY